MSIRRRTSDTFRVVSLMDDAVQDQLSIEEIYKYEMSRNLSDLPIDTMDPKPLIITLAPLPTWAENAARRAEDGDAQSAWLVFSKCATKFENDLEDVKIITERDGSTTLPEELRAQLPPSFVQEMASVLLQKADRGDLGPFSSRVGWRDLRSSRIILNAMNASGTAAAKTTADASG